jgi:hypothetical protein
MEKGTTEGRRRENKTSIWQELPLVLQPQTVVNSQAK